MRGVRKVLIALNGNKNVLLEGLNIAADEKSWVTVIKVIPEYEGDLDLTCIKNISDVLTSGKSVIKNQLSQAAEQVCIPVKPRIETGDIHRCILEVATQERCDIIIMGKPKQNRFKRLWGDNTLQKVISESPCPVLVVNV